MNRFCKRQREKCHCEEGSDEAIQRNYDIIKKIIKIKRKILDKLYSICDSKKSPQLFEICPYCGIKVNLLPIATLMDIYGDFTEFSNDDCHRVYFGLRECANPSCKNILAVKFTFVANQTHRISFTGDDEYICTEDITDLITLPEIDYVVRLEYVPDNIKKSFEEAQRCFYAGCYVAASVMIRKLLEELCEDFQIKGKDLNEKLDNLIQSNKIPYIIGYEIHDLRRFGNDGAHIKLKNFNNIGEKEVKIALEVIKNLLKIIYELNQNYQKSVNNLKALKAKTKL